MMAPTEETRWESFF